MSPLETMKSRRAAKKTELDELLNAPTTESRDLNEAESSKFDVLVEEIRKTDERIDQLVSEESRAAAAALVRVESGQTGEQRTSVRVVDPPIYAKGKVETSYFRDLYLARVTGDSAAAERLRRNDLMVMEKRALSTTAGAGLEFAPPEWIIEDFAIFARAGRKFADSIGPKPLPTGISSVNIPKITGGTSTAIQATNNAALSQTDMTTSSVTSAISTIGGKQVVSLQLLSQSGIPFDEVILQDLAMDYAKQFDNQVINGSGTAGQLNGVYTFFNASGTQNVTWTQATPAVGGAGGLYSKIFNACSNIETSRFMPPDTIWMHPRRWNWVLASSDSQNRPLVVPAGMSNFNNLAKSDGIIPQGVVGTFGGLDVVTDANIPTNLGAGTNQDPILVGYRADLRLWESALQTETFAATYADSAGILFRALAFSAAIPGRFVTSVSVVNGTGSVPPAF